MLPTIPTLSNLIQMYIPRGVAPVLTGCSPVSFLFVVCAISYGLVARHRPSQVPTPANSVVRNSASHSNRKHELASRNPAHVRYGIRVVEVRDDAQMHRAGRPEDEWEPLRAGATLYAGDSLSVDPDGKAVLQLPDGSTATANATSQMIVVSVEPRSRGFHVVIHAAIGNLDSRSKALTVTGPWNSNHTASHQERHAIGCGYQLRNVSYEPADPGLRLVLSEGFCSFPRRH